MGSVEKVFADINGSRQGMFIQSASPGPPTARCWKNPSGRGKYCVMEEPERARELPRADVLAGTGRLADRTRR